MSELRGAKISPCGRYRYSLWRRWDYDLPAVLFVMLNPSTADAEIDDPTIRRCMGFARRWGAGGIRVCNLYAWRATKPDALRDVVDVVGEPGGMGNQNDTAISVAAADAGRIIAAWGAWAGPLTTRTARVQEILRGRHVEALALTKDGSPRHPLYMRADVDPITYWDAGPRDPYAIGMAALRLRWTAQETPSTVVGFIFDALDEAGDTTIARTDLAREEAVVLVGMVFADLAHEEGGIDYGAVVSHALRAAREVGDASA